MTVSSVTVYLHLKKLGLRYQTPAYQDVEREPPAVEQFLNDRFPRIQRLANKIGADIGLEDAAGVGIMTRRGRTWGWVGATPVVHGSMERGGYHRWSMVTAKGAMSYSITDAHIQSERSIEFLQQLIEPRQKPLIVLVDRATLHASQQVRDLVRAHRARLSIYFLPKRAPELNPDEQVWNEVKHRRIGKQPVKNKKDLKKRLYSTLGSLQKRTGRILAFFQLPDTQYAAIHVS